MGSYVLSLDPTLTPFRVETQETLVYNAMIGVAFVSLNEGRSSGGLAQLGEHYVRNVGVGGSTPLPSTKPRLRVPAALQAKPLPY